MPSIVNIILLLQFIVALSTASLQLTNSYTLNATANIDYVSMLVGNIFVVWYNDGFLRLYDTSMVQKQAINFSILGVTKKYAVSPNQNTIVRGQGYIFCTYSLLTNYSNCNNESIYDYQSINSISFMDDSKIMVGLNYGYQYIDLDSNNSNQTFYYHNDNNAYTTINNANNFMITATFDMNLNQGLLWDNNLSNIPYGAFTNHSDSNAIQYYLIQSLEPPYIIASGLNNTDYQQYTVLYNYTTTHRSIVYSYSQSSAPMCITYYDSTVVIIYYNSTIIQYSLTNLSQLAYIGSLNYQINSLYMMMKHIYMNASDGEAYIFMHNYSKVIYVHRVRGMSYCLSINPHCALCDLTNNLNKCISCSAGYKFDTNNLCQIIIQNITQNTTNNSNQNIINNQSNSLLISLICRVGYQPNKNNTMCVPVECLDQNCSLCRTSDYCIVCEGEQMVEKDGKCQKMEIRKIIRQKSYIVVLLLSIPSIKMIIKPTTPFFIFLNDYWYYIYHNRQYQPTIHLMFNSILEINSQKLIPQFIDFQQLNKMKDVSQIFKSDYSLYTPETVYNTDQSDTQFVKNTQDMYTWNYLSSVIVLFFFKILYVFFRKYQQSNQKILKLIARFAFQNSLYKILLVSFLESNLIYITFYASLQLVQPSAFTTYDKIDNIISYLFLFTVVIFSFTFYIFIYAFCTKQEAKIFINYNTNHIDGYICQTFLSTSRNLLNGFIHAYLICNYTIQILSLLTIKIFTILGLYLLRNSFKKKSYLIFFQSYFVFGAIFDILLFLEEQNKLFLIQSYINDIQFYIICLIGSCSTVLVLLGLFYCIQQIFRLVFVKNKISDMDSQKSSNHEQAVNDKIQIQAKKQTNTHNLNALHQSNLVSSIHLQFKLIKIRKQKLKQKVKQKANKVKIIEKKYEPKQVSKKQQKIISQILKDKKIKKAKDVNRKNKLFIIQCENQDQV